MASARGRMGELVRYFLRLGLLGFGGPVALVGQMERELVDEQGWLTKEQMREAIAICQSLPGPLAIQVGIYISYLRGGFWGAWAGGWAFILPNFVIVAALGALYVHLGDLQAGDGDLLRRQPGGDRADPAFLLPARQARHGGLAAMGDRGGLLRRHRRPAGRGRAAVHRRRHRRHPLLRQPVRGGRRPTRSRRAAPRRWRRSRRPRRGSTLGKLLLFFLKAGSLTFGSGLVIVPFLEQGLVQQYGWLDQRQFLIAVAIGMISPGPVVITATFVGYLVAGFWGSLVSTVGIFLPSFLFVLIAAPLLARHRANPNVQGFVKGAYARRDRHDPRRLRPARAHRDRRLADGADRRRVARRAVPLEGEQSAADRGDRGRSA